MIQRALQIRAQVMREIRQYFTEQGFLEVETPVLIPANAPEEYIDPVSALPFQLQTSPEICMKRLLCRGYQRIFQISRCWRAGERGSKHLTEFTMLEWYRADADYRQLMADCRGLLCHIAATCSDISCFSHKGTRIDPTDTWEHISLQEAFFRFAKIDVLESVNKGLFDEILVSLVEPKLEVISAPVILYDYPATMAALARIKQNDPRFAERFELYIGGLELANGFSELTDADEQRQRFVEANRIRAKSGKQVLPLPEPFLTELSAMPPSAGIALGVDRLVMLTTGAEHIDDVVAFKPEDL